MKQFERAGGSITTTSWQALSPEQQERIYYLCTLTYNIHAVDGDSDLLDMTPALFHASGSLPDDTCHWILATVGGEIVGAMLVFFSGATVFGLLQGLDYKVSRTSMAYFNLLYALVRASIDARCSFIRCGGTTYWTKQRLGCELPAMDLHFAVSGGAKEDKMMLALQTAVSQFLSEAVGHAANFDG